MRSPRSQTQKLTADRYASHSTKSSSWNTKPWKKNLTGYLYLNSLTPPISYLIFTKPISINLVPFHYLNSDIISVIVPLFYFSSSFSSLSHLFFLGLEVVQLIMPHILQMFTLFICFIHGSGVVSYLCFFVYCALYHPHVVSVSI